MPGNLHQIVESTVLNAEEISDRTAQIHAAVLSKSKYIDNPDFTRIHTADLELLFAEYDDTFFEGQVKETLGTTPLASEFRERRCRIAKTRSRWVRGSSYALPLKSASIQCWKLCRCGSADIRLRCPRGNTR